MSLAIPQHTYEANTISGSAQVQFGNSYHYSTHDAKDAIYHDTLASTLREILEHKRLRGWNAYVPMGYAFVRPALVKLSKRMNAFEQSVKRLQEIEQTSFLSASRLANVDHTLEAVENDLKVTTFRTSVSKLLPKLRALARRSCSDRISGACTDEFCDLVDRMSRQVEVRQDIRATLDKVRKHRSQRVHADTLPESLHDGPPESGRASPSTLAALEIEQEYIYANQDFWRQLNMLLSKMLSLRKACLWNLMILLLYGAALYITCYFLILWIMNGLLTHARRTVYTERMIEVVSHLFPALVVFSLGLSACLGQTGLFPLQVDMGGPLAATGELMV